MFANDDNEKIMQLPLKTQANHKYKVTKSSYDSTFGIKHKEYAHRVDVPKAGKRKRII